MTNRAEIEELISRYSLAFDTGDLEGIAATLTADAVFLMRLPDSEPLTFDGREAIMKLMTDTAASQTDQRRHVNTNLLIEEAGDGIVRTLHYLTLVASENGETRVLSAGVYRLEIVEDAGVQRMQRLDLQLDSPF
ncbi:nuclear transport factor 2 family protein [Gordonia zhaorongruii]|uniref:nuclear transport factor 2 family protein n=1 Tax=Gordonia zhaorongruii TaxID=2597659 RepID=UPI001042B355|nr:nuclear transport factor 2 family protein [Gordonia zhaorongruii]